MDPGAIPGDPGDPGVEAGMAYGMVAGALLVGLTLGFIMGTRSRQILQSAKYIGESIRSWSFKIPAPAASEGEDDDGDKVEEDGDAGGLELSDFLAFQPTPLDEHPDIDINPCLMYQIKKFREQQKEEKRIAALAAEGLSEEEIAERLLAGDLPAGVGMGRSNALAVLVEHGARVLPVTTSGNADGLLVQERKRQLRTIDMYLAKALSIETKQASLLSDKNKGGKGTSAWEIAKKTELDRHGGKTLQRFERNLGIAKNSRNIFREWKDRAVAKGLYIEGQGDEDSDPDEAENKKKKKKEKKKGGGGGINANDLALIAMEFEAGGDGFGEDSGEEDAEDEATDLAA